MAQMLELPQHSEMQLVRSINLATENIAKATMDIQILTFQMEQFADAMEEKLNGHARNGSR